MEMEISCLTILTRESEIVSVYMVYLQGISHQFEISVINAFYNKFWNRFGKFFKRSWFFAFGIWKKASFAFLICYILVVNIYWCFNLLLFRWSRYMINCSWNIFDQVSAIFERLFSCYFVVPISHTRKFRKKKHTHHRVFFLQNHGKRFFLNSLFFQFNSRINRGFYFCKYSLYLKKFVEFYFAKTNSAKNISS